MRLFQRIASHWLSQNADTLPMQSKSGADVPAVTRTLTK